jgi:hypothetical protein
MGVVFGGDADGSFLAEARVVSESCQVFVAGLSLQLRCCGKHSRRRWTKALTVSPFQRRVGDAKTLPSGKFLAAASPVPAARCDGLAIRRRSFECAPIVDVERSRSTVAAPRAAGGTQLLVYKPSRCAALSFHTPPSSM